MYIELISKASMWCGDKGVVMNIKARVYPTYTTVPLPGFKPDPIDIDSREVEVSISGLGEVSANSISDQSSLGVEGVWCVKKWLVSSGLLSEWGEETARYTSALSRVELSWTPIDVQRREFLEYSLKLGDEDIAITVSVFVSHKVAVISTGLRTGDDKYEDNSSIGLYDSTITGPVTTDTVKAAVCKSLDKLWDLVRLPLIED